MKVDETNPNKRWEKSGRNTLLNRNFGKRLRERDFFGLEKVEAFSQYLTSTIDLEKIEIIIN